MLHFKRMSLVASALALGGAVQTAAAEKPAQSLTAPLKMPDLSSRSALRFDLGVVRSTFDGDDETVTSVVSVASAQLVVAPGALLSLRLPMTYARSSEDGDDTSESDLGNIAVGARVTGRSGNTHAGGGVMLHLPTAPKPVLFSDSDDGAGALIASFSQFDSFADFAPDTTTVRVGGDLRVDSGRAFFQMHAGFEHYMFGNDDNDTLDLVRVSVGGGIHTKPNMAIVGEITTLSTALEDEELFDEGSEEFFHWLDVGFRYDTGKAVLGWRVYVPIDSPLDEIDSLGVGFDATVPL